MLARSSSCLLSVAVAITLLVQPGESGLLDSVPILSDVFGASPAAEGPAAGPGSLPRPLMGSETSPAGAPVSLPSPDGQETLQTDECSGNSDCGSCLEQKHCVFCTEPVEFHDGSRGSNCIYHDPFRQTHRFKCHGTYSEKMCKKPAEGVVEKLQYAAEDLKDSAVEAMAVQAEKAKIGAANAVGSAVSKMESSVTDAVGKVIPLDKLGLKAESAAAPVGLPEVTPEEAAADSGAPTGQPAPRAAEEPKPVQRQATPGESAKPVPNAGGSQDVTRAVPDEPKLLEAPKASEKPNGAKQGQGPAKPHQGKAMGPEEGNPKGAGTQGAQMKQQG